MPGTVILVDPQGITREVPVEAVAGALERPGWRVQTEEDRLGRVATAAKEADYGGAAGTAKAGLAATLRGATLGGSDVLARAVGGEQAALDLENYRDVHSGLSTGFEIGGAVVPALFSGGALTPAGAAARLGRGVAGLGAKAGAAGKLGAAIAGGAVEGGLQGVGTAVSELALSQEPLTWERATSVLSSNALFGAATGGVLGGAGHVAGNLVERGLSRASKVLDDGMAARAARDAADAVPSDLAALDRKGLAAARQAELDAIETARVPQRQQFADDLDTFRKETRDAKIFLATKDADVKGIGEVKQMAKVFLEADRKIDRLLNNPKYLAENPKFALGHLQQQENALAKIAKSEPELRAVFAADATGARAAALDAIAPTLERNRALQARVRDLVSDPVSERLAAIDAAREALSLPKPKPEPSMLEKATSGALFGALSTAAHGIPVVGQIPGVAQLIGAKGAEILSGLVFGRLGKATGAIAERSQDAARAFVGAAKAAAPAVKAIAPAAIPLATKTLAAVRYAPPSRDREEEPKTLAGLFKSRTDEIKSQTAYDEQGIPRMRPEARAEMAKILAPIRAVDSIMADRMETLAARRIEYLSSIIPRQPDFGTPQIGPNRWQPSDMQMRSFARSAAAVEDPDGVEARAANGLLVPEDARAYWACYPERAQDFTRKVFEELPQLTKPLPYSKCLTLGMLTGKPVDPSMTPRVRNVLQASYPDEPGSEGGTAAPKAQPQMGSIKKSVDAPTQAQSRSQGAML